MLHLRRNELQQLCNYLHLPTHPSNQNLIESLQKIEQNSPMLFASTFQLYEKQEELCVQGKQKGE